MFSGENYDKYDVEKAGKEVEERDKFLSSDEAAAGDGQGRDSPTRIGYSKQKEAGDGQVSFRNVSGDDEDLQPLNKEELFAQTNSAGWSRSRWFFIILFWLAFVAMLIAVICIILAAPKCPGNMEWYKSGISYQIFPRTFSDSNGDGVGDIQGIIQRLDYLSSLGIQSLWLGPIFSHGNMDNGNDVTNFTEIDPVLGTMEEYKMLIKEANSQGMRVILNFIPNHSSKDHPWFQASEKDGNPFYIWESGNATQPPNNWLSVLGGSAWSYSQSRQEWYLHTFLPEEPDLNYRDPELVETIQDTMKFWLELGTSGFYMHNANYLVELEDKTEDELPNIYIIEGDDDNTLISSINFNHSRDLDENHAVIYDWRNLMNGYNGHQATDFKLLVVDVEDSGLTEQVQYFGSKDKPEADYTFNQALLSLSGFQTGSSLSKQIQGWLSAKPKDGITSWALGNARNARAATRFQELAKAMNVLLLTLPGTANVFYGEEIGMTNLETEPIIATPTTSPLVTQDVNNSSSLTNTSAPVLIIPVASTDQENSETQDLEDTFDPVVTAMQWNNMSNAGFTNLTEELSIPVNENYLQINVEAQENDPSSMLNIFRKLSGLRSQASFQDGNFKELVVSDNIYAFTRRFSGWTGYLVALNLDLDSNPQHFRNSDPNLPEFGTVTLSTDPGRLVGHPISLNNLILSSYEAIIISYE